jgi:hypothetical protein
LNTQYLKFQQERKRTLPAGRAFSRRLYLVTAKAKKTLQLNEVTEDMNEDLLMLKYFM